MPRTKFYPRSLCFGWLVVNFVCVAPVLAFFVAQSASSTPRSRGPRPVLLPPLAKKDATTTTTTTTTTPRTTKDVLYTLPLFPLRKSIKLPGESLTLHLYEERYLALAEYILKNSNNHHDQNATPPQQRVFGALYASNKPQIVTQRGQGPIVPMMEKGDLGVLFLVERYEEAMRMMPTHVSGDSGDTLERRRRVCLVGTGVARFCIERILHNGYGGAYQHRDEKEGDGSQPEPLPFIVAQVSLYTDDKNEYNNTETTSLDDCCSSSNNNLSPERMAWLTHRASMIGIPETVMHREFPCFWRASKMVRDAVSDDRKALLASRSSQERWSTLERVPR